MTGYLIRRILQMILIVFLSATAAYALLNLAPGGPLSGLRQKQQTNNFRLTQEDIARIRAYFELDLYLPVRFSRWLIGQPRGPIVIGNYELFANKPVGCYLPVEATVRLPDGQIEDRIIGCKQYVYLSDLEGRRVSRGVIFGDFGRSWRLLRDRPVTTLLASRLNKTVQLAGISTLFSLLFGIPIGVYSAVKQYSRFDYVFTTLAFMGSAMPTFFFGILMVLFFSVMPKLGGLPYLPPGSAEAVQPWTIPGLGTIQSGSALDQALHLILPVATLTLVQIAQWSRFIRGSMLEVLRQDYVRTARAKGLKERVVILKHALRNGLIPFITILVFFLPGLFAGAIVTETIFSWPGMGRLYFLALNEYDYPVAMSVLLITAILTVIATLLRDILYSLVDPRIRFS